MLIPTKLAAPSQKVYYKTVLPLTDSLAITLVWCPPGQFCMSRSLVVLTQSFLISRTLVTNQVWKYVMDGHTMSNGSQQRLFHAQQPVEGLSWDSAMTFCLKLTELLRAKGVLRRTQKITLPTEAQWEYACRAGTQSGWHFGSDESTLQDYAWYRANSSNHAHPVGLKKPNPWGITDLYGNLAEWCLDDYLPLVESTSSQIDPLCQSEDALLKVTRGGAYTHLASECDSASREPILRENPFSEPTGIRLICKDESN